MRASNRLDRLLRFVAFACVVGVISACAAPAPNGDARTAGDAESVASASPASQPAPVDSRQAKPPTKRPMRTGGPLPPVRVEDLGSGPAVDTSCRTDADCTVKNVGNCCGYYPACVNVDSPTDPKGVQAECAKKGTLSVCGFPEISSCSCKQGHCEAVSDGVAQ